MQQCDWVATDTECSLKRLPLAAAEILLSSMSRRTRLLDITAYLMSVLGGGEQCCSGYLWRKFCPDDRTQHKWKMCCLLIFAGKLGMEKLLRFAQTWGG